jgi:hypothetical protein
LFGPRFAFTLWSGGRFAGGQGERGRVQGSPTEVQMQWLLLIGAVVLGLAITLGTASLLLSLVFRVMSKLR